MIRIAAGAPQLRPPLHPPVVSARNPRASGGRGDRQPSRSRLGPRKSYRPESCHVPPRGGILDACAVENRPRSSGGPPHEGSTMSHLVKRKQSAVSLLICSCLLMLLPAALLASDVRSSYTLSNKFGTVVTIHPQGGDYSVAQLPRRPRVHRFSGEEQSWFGTGLISVFANHRWFRSSDSAFHHVRGDETPDGRLCWPASKPDFRRTPGQL